MVSRLGVVVFASMAFVVGCGSTAGQAVAGGPSESNEADKVIMACRRAYADCTSYRDGSHFTRSGQFQTAATAKSGTYETLFARPGSLRIDQKYHESQHDVLWWIDGIAKAYFSQHDAWTTRDLAPLASLVAQKTGDVPYHVPSLLLANEFEPSDFFKDNGISKLEESTVNVDNVECYLLTGERNYEDVSMITRTRVWIGKSDYLIRKIESKHEILGTLSEIAVATIKPETGVKLEPSDFIFKVPASAVARD